MAKKNARVQQIMAHTRAQAGLDRKHFFASNGDLAQWRGRATVQKDRKKEEVRKKCRGKVSHD